MTSDELNWRFLHAPKVFFYVSLAVHLCLPLFFLSMQALDRMGWSLLGPRKQTNELYQEFIQVDVVGLPDQMFGEDPVDTSLPVNDKAQPPTKVESGTDPETTKADAAEADVMAELEAKKAEAEKVRLAQEAEEKARKDAARKDRENALKALEMEAKREAALKELANSGSRGQLKGNILSKGTSSKGRIGTAKDRYISLIAQKVKQHFNIFDWQRNRKLVTVVFIRVNPQGGVTEKRVTKASGDRQFDNLVIQAVEAASPLPIPDDQSILDDGISIEFRPDE